VDGVGEVLEAAREAYRRRDWPGARERFAAARAAGELTATDLDALADAAWWLGEVEQASAVLEAAYRRHLDEGRPGRAAMARRVREIGRRHADPNLTAAGDLFEGRVLVRRGRMAGGMALLDEAMLAVLSGELAPEYAGNIYCHLMAAFAELADVRRAAEWTEATGRWLATLPAAVLFTGVCRVHRCQVLQRKGAWAEAEREAALVCRDLADLHVAGAAEGQRATTSSGSCAASAAT
jgi:hypothetical protein